MLGVLITLFAINEQVNNLIINDKRVLQGECQFQ